MFCCCRPCFVCCYYCCNCPKRKRFDKLSKRGQQLAATSCGSFCFKSWCCLFCFVVLFDCCYCQNCTVWELTVGLLSKRGKQLAATTCGGKGKWSFHPGNTCARQLTTGSTKKKQGNTKGKIQEIQNEIQEIEKSKWSWYELVRTQLVLLKAKEIVDRNNQHFAFFESRFGIPWYARTQKNLKIWYFSLFSKQSTIWSWENKNWEPLGEGVV